MKKASMLAVGASLLGVVFALGGGCGGSSGGGTGGGGTGGIGGSGGDDGCGGDGCDSCGEFPPCPTTLPTYGALCESPSGICLDTPICSFDVVAGCGPTTIEFYCEEGWVLHADPACAATCFGHTSKAACTGDPACRWVLFDIGFPDGCHPVNDCLGDDDCPSGSMCFETQVEGRSQFVCVQ
ncbi:MAG: hypothetical protein QM820_30530 [Minicystis sp.]